MTLQLLPGLAGLAEPAPPFVRVVVAAVEGSAPREAGAAMLVDNSHTHGTIGGGQLEFEAIAHARAMLSQMKPDDLPWRRDMRTWPLGPSLGQCCGGVVRVFFERVAAREACELRALLAGRTGGELLVHPVGSGHPPQLYDARQQARALPLPAALAVADMLSGARPRNLTLACARGGPVVAVIEPLMAPPVPLFVYGAGHVGRALVKIADDLDFEIHWIDTHKDRFPNEIAPGVRPIVATTPERIAAAAPTGAFHLVLTYSHALDLAICQALLSRPIFGFLGLIGSRTKSARFRSRLREAGVDEATLKRLTCPVGAASFASKAPAAIAISMAAQLIARAEELRRTNAKSEQGTEGAEDMQISA